MHYFTSPWSNRNCRNGTKNGLIKFCLGPICLLAVYLKRPWLSPLNLTGPLSQPLLWPLRGRGAFRDTMKRVTRALMAGVTRGSLHFTEVQESHMASGGIYEGGGKAKALARRGGVGRRTADTVYVPTLLKAANLEKGQTHTLTKAHRNMCINMYVFKQTHIHKICMWRCYKDVYL